MCLPFSIVLNEGIWMLVEPACLLWGISKFTVLLLAVSQCCVFPTPASFLWGLENPCSNETVSHLLLVSSLNLRWRVSYVGLGISSCYYACEETLAWLFSASRIRLCVFLGGGRNESMHIVGQHKSWGVTLLSAAASYYSLLDQHLGQAGDAFCCCVGLL